MSWEFWVIELVGGLLCFVINGWFAIDLVFDLLVVTCRWVGLLFYVALG